MFPAFPDTDICLSDTDISGAVPGIRTGLPWNSYVFSNIRFSQHMFFVFSKRNHLLYSFIVVYCIEDQILQTSYAPQGALTYV